MGQQGWEQVQSFLWDNIAKRTEEFYINMLGLQEPQVEVLVLFLPLNGSYTHMHPDN